MKPSAPYRTRTLIRGGLFLGLLALLGLGVAVLWYFPPTENSFYPRCQLHSLTGLHCPGCGLTRSASSIIHGEFIQALAYNVLCPIVLPVLAWCLLSSVWNSAFPARAVNIRLPKWFVRVLPVLLFVALIGFFIVRNIPAYPFDLLAPHELK